MPELQVPADWYDMSMVSNRLRQTYVNGFLDVSNIFTARRDANIVGTIRQSEEGMYDAPSFVGTNVDTLTVNENFTLDPDCVFTFNSNDISNTGVFNNDGSLNNTGNLSNTGVFNNDGSLNNTGVFNNDGSLNNTGDIINNGRIINNGTLEITDNVLYTDVSFAGTSDISVNIGLFSGNVGIGTDSAIPKLDVSGAVFLRNETLTFASGGGGGAATEEVALVFNAGFDNRTLALKTDSDANLYGTYGAGGGRYNMWKLGGSNYFQNSVGIGTESPFCKLDVWGGIHLRSENMGRIHNDGGSDDSNRTNTYIAFAEGGSDNDWAYLRQIGGSNAINLALDFHDDHDDCGFIIRTVNSTQNPDVIYNRFCVAPGGNVGIGTNNPIHQLYMTGNAYMQGGLNVRGSWDVINYSDAEADYLTNGGQVQANPPSYNFSLHVANAIQAQALVVTSDQRIKDNIEEIKDDLALQQLRQLRPSTYTYKDTYVRGSKPVIGFIAQEVREVLPHAVTNKTGVIPNILKPGIAHVMENNITELRLGIPMDDDIQLTNTSIIQVNVANRTIDINVVSCPNKNVIEIVTNDDITNEAVIVVYGEIIEDFHYLNKSSIFTVATAALQEVDRQQQADKAKIATLETENATLKTQITDILARLSSLESAQTT
jgi:hypothetical protein